MPSFQQTYIAKFGHHYGHIWTCPLSCVNTCRFFEYRLNEEGFSYILQEDDLT